MPNRRILSIWFPRLAAERHIRRDPNLGDVPFVVVRDVGQAQVALLDRDRVGFDRFIVHMQVAEFAARAAEGPEVGGLLHSGDARQLFDQVVGKARSVIR